MGRQAIDRERYWEVSFLWSAGVHGKKQWKMPVKANAPFSRWKAVKAVRKRCRGARILSVERMWNMDSAGMENALNAEVMLHG